MLIMKKIDFSKLSDMVGKFCKGEKFITKVEFVLTKDDAVTFEILESLYPGPREELINSIIQIGLMEHARQVAPILELIRLRAGLCDCPECRKERENGEEGKG
jgi:hypothetical protein